MSYQRPTFRHPGLPENDLGFTKKDYEGAISTLCSGCGHDSISAAMVQAFYEMSIEPHRIAKISGIGCSSKTPTYFLGNSHGFNSVHGRMPSVATGAQLANRDLIYIGVSGDGDTGSIGMGQFVHAIRKNLNMVYIVMNNGCYGLTKGQDSATADRGSKNKAGEVNVYDGIDLAGLALELGATFVARSFSGDKTQLLPLLKAAVSHQGFALLDVVSPCVTFNNNLGSTKSYEHVREKQIVSAFPDYVPVRTEITTEYESGDAHTIVLHDGSHLLLKKLAPDSDPTDRRLASMRLNESREKGEILTGLIYFEPKQPPLHDMLNTSLTPLNQFSEKDLCPGQAALDKINAGFR